MKNHLKILVSLFISLAVFMPAVSIAAGEISMNRLLETVRQGRAADAAENARRENEFKADAARQEALIRQAQQQVAQLEAESAQLEAQFNQNELAVNEKKAQRDERLGSLKELFGHLTGAAGDLRSRFRNSITTTQYPDRIEFLTGLIKKMNDDTDLPTMEEIERLWFEMHRELTETGQVDRYTAKIGTDETTVARVGTFNLFANDAYVGYEPDGSANILPRQPSNVVSPSNVLTAGAGSVVPVSVDPTGPKGGGFLKALINTPTLIERWHNGGLVGYIITAVGILGVLLAVWRWLVISGVSGRVKRQLKAGTPNTNNPLGRVLKVAEDNPNSDLESLELKLGEQIIKERPAIMRFVNLLKVIAMVAPLMGLLGTVTGMIKVFSAIVIYGTGDPSTMAGGISQALVTTVLGLCVAIPMLLLHSIVNSKAKGVLHVLEEQSAGIVAERSGK